VIRTGTSGFSYREWKPAFYPRDLPLAKMLAHYASRLACVEVNNTFYKRPEKKTLEAWAVQVPDGFEFVFKASRYFSAGTALRNAQKPLEEFFALLAGAGKKLGPLLVVLPPHVKKDTALLTDFLDAVPKGRRVTIEARDASWRSDDVFDAMRARDVAWCVNEGDDETLNVVTTASWSYFRLRKERYDKRALAAWADRLAGKDGYAIFRHDETGASAKNAVALAALLSPSPKP
jgi:uncharacterized protein YecE (DUF72 family)